VSLLRAAGCGRLPYQEAWDCSVPSTRAGRRAGPPTTTCCCWSTAPTYTVGRSGARATCCSPRGSSPAWARSCTTSTGGRHHLPRPGQLVGYPIVHLGESPDPVPYVRRLERVLVLALADLDIEAWPEAGYTGVWTAAGKWRPSGCAAPAGSPCMASP